MGFSVSIAKNNLHFAASHFITFGGKCEFLHGHNYGLTIELEGPLTADSYVYDFVALKKTARAISEQLDHCFLLPMNNPHMTIRKMDHHWEIDYKDSHYVFPEKDVKPLPVDNITAERLAEYIWGKFAEVLHADPDQCLEMLTVGVEEADGQAAWYRAGLKGASGSDIPCQKK